MANENQRLHWNDQVRLTAWRQREPLTSAVTPMLLGGAHLAEGERVLDVGSGGGHTTIAAARLVGPGGSAVGADISEPLVALAGRRAAEAGIENVGFEVADMQVASVDGHPFDVAMSQFGVMFFDDAEAAFANIRSQVRSGGRLVFCCWRDLEDNPWFVGTALRPFLAPPPEPAKNPVGPFTLADPDRTSAMLAAAGWSSITRTPFQLSLTVRRETLMDDDAYLLFLGVDAERLDEARTACERHLAPLRRDGGDYEAPLAFSVVTARN